MTRIVTATYRYKRPPRTASPLLPARMGGVRVLVNNRPEGDATHVLMFAEATTIQQRPSPSDSPPG